MINQLDITIGEKEAIGGVHLREDPAKIEEA
jgi:hypothetical protein